jgi:hypothetical protein
MREAHVACRIMPCMNDKDGLECIFLTDTGPRPALPELAVQLLTLRYW